VFCVKIDLTKPIGRVQLKDFWNHIKYEGLHRICSIYGCYDLLSRDCMTEINVTNHDPNVVANIPNPSMMEATIGSCNGRP